MPKMHQPPISTYSRLLSLSSFLPNCLRPYHRFVTECGGSPDLQPCRYHTCLDTHPGSRERYLTYRSPPGKLINTVPQILELGLVDPRLFNATKLLCLRLAAGDNGHGLVKIPSITHRSLSLFLCLLCSCGDERRGQASHQRDPIFDLLGLLARFGTLFLSRLFVIPPLDSSCRCLSYFRGCHGSDNDVFLAFLSETK